MKNYLILTNDCRNEIISEKELKRINKIDEKFDGISSVFVVCEVDPNKVADNRWTTTKPDFPCLFIHRFNHRDDRPGMMYASLSEGVLVLSDIECNEFMMTMDEFTDKGEFFVVERLK